MKQLTLDAFKDYKFLSGLTYSPCGQYLSYQVHQSQKNLKDYDSNLWITNLNTKIHRPYTASNDVKGHTWLPQTNQIIFPSLKSPDHKKRVEAGEPLTVYYAINPLGGESQAYMEIPLAVGKIHALTDQKFLLQAKYDPFFDRFHLLSKEDKEKKLEVYQESKDYEVIEKIPFWSNGGTYKRRAINRLYLFDATSSELTPITGPDFNVDSFKLKDNQVLYTGSPVQDKMTLFNELHIVDLVAHKSRPLIQEDLSVQYAYFLDDQTLGLVVNDRKTYGLNQNPSFKKLDLESQTLTDFIPHLDQAIGNSVGSDCRLGAKTQITDDQGKLYFVTTRNENAPLYCLSPDGSLETLVDPQGSVDDLAVHQGQVAYIAMVNQHLNEIFTLNKASEQLTEFNAWVNEAYTIIQPEEVKSRAPEGPEIQGWVMLPKGYEEDKIYPAILNIHGGPKTVYGTVFYHEMQAWANAGYMVCFCNPRGSDGRGNNFADIRGKYGTVDYADIMAFADQVIKSYPSLDKDNFFVTGGSYGGFMTNWIVGHTNRFKAGASQRSISNWMTEYGVTDIGYFFVPDQMAADPFDDYEKMWFHSPLKYVKNVTTPLLFIHSDMDYRCWIPEALQMFTALKDLGQETKLVIFKGENHELSRGGKPNHRLRRLSEITNWFNDHLS